MIIGDPNTFAIESVITEVYERPSWRALGLFCIHIGGRRFGVYEPDSSMLACSFDAVERRIAARGEHVFSLIEKTEATLLARSIIKAKYDPHGEDFLYFGMSHSQFKNELHDSGIWWAPDGDEAFDDGSHVLHFDTSDTVRLIGFVNGQYDVDGEVIDVRCNASYFYGVLEEWKQLFENECSQRAPSNSP